MNGPLTSCDTFVALAEATLEKQTIFAKNSDRPDDEQQRYVLFEPAEYQTGATVRTQYLEIPQAQRTYRLLGAQPLWLWGFEHGVNEWGLAIGNEAIYTKATGSGPGLLGMDLVRLGLERCKTAAEAVELYGLLIEEHGIGGSARENEPYFYDNGFLISDPQEVWHLETSGHDWVARVVKEPALAISNEPSIGTEWNKSSEGIHAHLEALGWVSDSGDPNFAEITLDRHRPRGQAVCRRGRGTELLYRDSGRLETEHLLGILRDHYEGTPLGAWTPADLDIKSICMHSTPYHQVKTAGSIVTHLRPERGASLMWLAVGQPCRRVFVPYRLDEIEVQADLDVTAKVEELLEARLQGKSEEQEAQILTELRTWESELLVAVREGGLQLRNIREEFLDRLRR